MTLETRRYLDTIDAARTLLAKLDARADRAATLERLARTWGAL